MSAQFCHACGRPLTPGARFCSHCGARVVHAGESLEALYDDSGLMRQDTQDTQQHIDETQEYPFSAADLTASYDPTGLPTKRSSQPIQEAPHKPGRIRPAASDGSLTAKRAWITIILVLIAVVCTAGALMYFNVIPLPTREKPPAAEQDKSAEQTASETTSFPEDQEQLVNDQGQDSPVQLGIGLSEELGYEALLSMYRRLDGFKDQVDKTVSIYNGAVYQDRAIREKRLTEAKDLHQEITSVSRDISTLNIGTSQQQDKTNIKSLYDALASRVQVVIDAYTISLQYDDTAAHMDEINQVFVDAYAPGKSQSKYKLYFDEHYKDAEPSQRS